MPYSPFVANAHRRSTPRSSTGVAAFDVGDEGALALAASPHLTKVSDLEVREHSIGAKGRAALKEPWPFAQV